MFTLLNGNRIRDRRKNKTKNNAHNVNSIVGPIDDNDW